MNVQVEASKALAVLLTYGAHRSSLKLHTCGGRSTPVFNRNTDLEERGTQQWLRLCFKINDRIFFFYFVILMTSYVRKGEVLGHF